MIDEYVRVKVIFLIIVSLIHNNKTSLKYLTLILTYTLHGLFVNHNISICELNMERQQSITLKYDTATRLCSCSISLPSGSFLCQVGSALTSARLEMQNRPHTHAE